MELREPTKEYTESFRKALAEFASADIHGFWEAKGDIEDIAAYIEQTRRNAAGEDLAEGWVPASTYWLIDDGQFVAHANVRHTLNPRLEQIGGHIGYAVRPSMHGKGYGSTMMKLVLPKARALGIERALVTCDPGNIASRRIIEKNGGVLQDEIVYEGRPVLRFWMAL